MIVLLRSWREPGWSKVSHLIVREAGCECHPQRLHYRVTETPLRFHAGAGHKNSNECYVFYNKKKKM